jgi:hypothetical protein
MLDRHGGGSIVPVNRPRARLNQAERESPLKWTGEMPGTTMAGELTELVADADRFGDGKSNERYLAYAIDDDAGSHLADPDIKAIR